MKASKILIAKLSSSNKQNHPLHIFTLPDLELSNNSTKSESVYYCIEELIPYFFPKSQNSILDQIFKSSNSEYDLIKDENSGMTLMNSDFLNDLAIQNQWYTLALLSKENKIGLLTGKINNILESLRLPNIQIYSNFVNVSLDIKPARLRSMSVPPGNPNSSPLPGHRESEHSPRTNHTNTSTPQFNPPSIQDSRSRSFEYTHQSHPPAPESLRQLDTCLPSSSSDYPSKRITAGYTPKPKTLIPPAYPNPTARVRGRPRKPITHPYPQASISPSLGHFGHFKIDPPPQEMILLPPTTPSALRPRYHSPSAAKSPIHPTRPPTQPVHRPPFEPRIRPPQPQVTHHPLTSDHPLEWCRKEVYSLINLSSELRYRLLKLEECMGNLQPHHPPSSYVPPPQSFSPPDTKSYSPYHRPAPGSERH